MNKQTQEALKMAIETMEFYVGNGDNDLDKSIKACKEALSETDKEKAELQAQINELRKALEDIAKHTPENFWQNKAAQEALAKTAPQCLQEHDNEVIERCAKVCEYLPIYDGITCAEEIRELKELNHE